VDRPWHERPRPAASGAAAAAEALSTIDWLAGGRLIVVVGVGWLRE
jgi:alkanesulfonate monooxygenase SsuD/methylene tetrahydromethanopterin reductase-like flavin-dependent oxidoreductase (luciferase family)